MKTRCPYRNYCRAFLNSIQEEEAELIKENFKELNNEEKRELYKKIKIIVQFANEFSKEIEKEVIEGSLDIDGYKLVQKRTVRKICDEEKAVEILKKNNFTDEQIYTERKLKTPAQLETALGKETVQRTIGQLIFKPKAKLTLVKDDDYRPKCEIKNRKIHFVRCAKSSTGGVKNKC